MCGRMEELLQDSLNIRCPAFVEPEMSCVLMSIHQLGQTMKMRSMKGLTLRRFRTTNASAHGPQHLQVSYPQPKGLRCISQKSQKRAQNQNPHMESRTRGMRFPIKSH